MKFGSLFAGIGGFDLGFERAGLQPVWQSEIDPSCLKILNQHWPQTERLGDVAKLRGAELPAVDLIAGGFPCQDVSVAGRRSGLAGERSGLWFQFHRVLAEHRPAWVVIENVPGLLSSQGGRDFALILRGLVELGYGVAWRILDAQHFGVPQRRRRVFIVGYLGDYRAVEVLFESESLQGNLEAGEQARERTAADIVPSLAASGHGTARAGESRGQDPVIAVPDPAYAVSAGQGGSKFGSGRERQHPNSNAPGRGGEDDENLVLAFTHSGYSNQPAWITGDRTDALPAGGQHPSSHQGIGVIEHFGVRRLTPTECERLQGFPDGWTEDLSDSARYRVLGNAVCATVSCWLGTRLRAVEEGKSPDYYAPLYAQMISDRELRGCND